MKIWSKYNYILASSVSLWAFFSFHPKLVVASCTSNFSPWTSAQVDRFINLGPRMGLLFQTQIIQTVGCSFNMTFQYIQVKNVVAKLQRSCDIFRPLMDFEKILRFASSWKGILSKWYLMLSSNIMVEDKEKAQWECDLQVVITQKTWGNICWFGHIISPNISIQENILKIQLRWWMISLQLSKLFPNVPDNLLALWWTWCIFLDVWWSCCMIAGFWKLILLF